MRPLLTATATFATAGILAALTSPPVLAAPSVGLATSSTASSRQASPVTHAQNPRVPEGAAWSQHYFPTSDGSGAELHADVLLPEGLEAGDRVPVILSVGPYFAHAGELFPEGLPQTGPSDRFNDLVEEGRLLERGYALVMVDSRGFGGSTGCLDFGGPREQADVKAAIDWAATQPWSTGRVGMYGKSADATTGLLGNNLKHEALDAVVAQEPIWDLYRNIYSGGVPRTTAVEIPTIYNAGSQIPGMPDDDPRYRANAAYEATHPECLTRNLAGYRIADPGSRHWKERDMAARARGTDTPLLFTQGFLEWNTEAEGMSEFLDNHRGPVRAWLGQWDHVRGNERGADGTLKMGRAGWFDEVMSFYDQHLKGIAPKTRYAAFVVQDSTGRWRGQDSWPEAGRTSRIALGRGAYVDDGRVGRAGQNSYLVRSAPVTRATRVTGTPALTMQARGRGNVMVRLHDVAPDGTAVMFDEQVSMLRPGQSRLELKSTDWTLARGHVLAVEIGTVQPEKKDPPAAFGPGGDWLDTPSGSRVRVAAAYLELALDSPRDDRVTQGGPAAYQQVYRAVRTDRLPAGRASFTLSSPRG